MLDLYQYNLPFKTRLITGAGNFSHRSGILLNYKDHKYDLLSEASPLPGFSMETIDEVKSLLLKHRENLDLFLLTDFNLADLKNFMSTIPQVPSIQFSVSFLGLALLSNRNQMGINEILGIPSNREIKVNDIIGHEDPDQMFGQIEKSVKNGFTTLKFKAPAPPYQLATILSKAVKKYPGIIFRLDANQSWPEERLSEYSSLFNNLPVEYIEEPVSCTRTGQLKTIREKCALPVALDESLRDFQTLRFVLDLTPPVFIIVKPMLFGNIFKLLETITEKRSTCTNVVVTTTLESGVGRFMTTCIASLVGDSELAHGLNTGHLLKQDLIPDLNITNGIITTTELDLNKCMFRIPEDSSILKLIT